MASSKMTPRTAYVPPAPRRKRKPLSETALARVRAAAPVAAPKIETVTNRAERRKGTHRVIDRTHNSFNPIPASAVDLAQAVRELKALGDAIYTVELPDNFKRSLRPSGLPYCPVLDATKVEARVFSRDFYLDIGTAFHEVVQTFVCRSGIARSMVYANFRCAKCDTVEYFKPLPYKCAHCGAPDHQLKYEELDFLAFRGLGGGHIDLFVKTSYGWLVCDWKTTSITANKYREHVDNKHHHQLQAYCLAISELFAAHLQGLPVIGYALIFAPREHPGSYVKAPAPTAKLTAVQAASDKMISNWNIITHPFYEDIAAATRKRLKRAKKQFALVSEAYDSGEWEAVAKSRPCKSIADFAKPMGMIDGFYKGEMCKNIELCSAGYKTVAKFLKAKAVKRV